MPFGGIAAYDKDTSRLPNLIDGIGHGTATETGGQTGHRRGMSEAGTVVQIVSLHHRAGEFLSQVILLVGAFG